MLKSFERNFYMNNNNFGMGIFDYSCRTSREETVSRLIKLASKSKNVVNAYWKKMRAYYDGDHETRAHSTAFAAEQDISWEAAQSTDGFIHVESQVDTKVPDFEFSPREVSDYDRAKQREKITRFVCDINCLELKNALNERRLGILGSAIYKVCWDNENQNGTCGEIKIDIPKPEQILPDPCSSTVDGCEYIGYVYRIHKQKARRIFGNDLLRLGENIEDFFDKNRTERNYFDCTGETFDDDSAGQTVTVTEWWFRQPQDGHETISLHDADGKKVSLNYKWKSGDIALSIFLGSKEIRYIPKYWNNTACDMFPFVIYSKIPNEDSIWGKSELEALVPLIDASDRELAYAQLNSAFSSNDIIVAEENALSDDGELDNSPGAVWKLRPGMMGKIQRLGNGGRSELNQYSNSDFWREIMKETTGNYELNQGIEPTRVTTASGIALLNERAKNRQMMKKVIKSEGFRRLYELIDRTALEYYDDERIIHIGAVSDDGKVYTFSEMTKSGDDDRAYIPVVDVKIHVGDNISNSKAFTIQAISELMKTPVTADNFRFIQSYIELIGLPMRGQICDQLEKKFAQNSLEAPVSDTSLPDITKISGLPDMSKTEVMKNE